MSEFCLPNTITPTKKAEYEKESSNISRLVLSGGYLLCSVLISHPLYFLYFIFFSPYLLKLLSFLSPLFITTALLLLLALLAVSPAAAAAADELSDSTSFTKMLFLRADIAIRAVVEKLRWREHEGEEEGEESHRIVRTVQEEEVEVYRIVFEVAAIPVRGEEPSPLGDDCSRIERPLETLTRDCGGIPRESEEKEIWCETVSYRRDEEEEKVIEIPEHVEKAKNPLMSAAATVIDNQMNEGETLSRVGNARAIEEEDARCQKKLEIVTSKGEKPWNLGSSGSMRKEKEWKRTLACKLFEERHNKTDEGMDSLWETYETTDANKLHNSSSRSKKKETKKKQYAHGAEEDDDDDEEEDEDGEAAAKLCCLQALKFSAGKMNMGMRMGRPGFVNISKAFKGIGWFHPSARHHARRSII